MRYRPELIYYPRCVPPPLAGEVAGSRLATGEAGGGGGEDRGRGRRRAEHALPQSTADGGAGEDARNKGAGWERRCGEESHGKAEVWGRSVFFQPPNIAIGDGSREFGSESSDESRGCVILWLL